MEEEREEWLITLGLASLGLTFQSLGLTFQRCCAFSSDIGRTESYLKMVSRRVLPVYALLFAAVLVDGVSSGPWCVSEVVECCAQCLDLFIQLNWTGPPSDGVKMALERVLGQVGLKLLNQQALMALSSDGEVSHNGAAILVC